MSAEDELRALLRSAESLQAAHRARDSSRLDLSSLMQSSATPAGVEASMRAGAVPLRSSGISDNRPAASSSPSSSSSHTYSPSSVSSTSSSQHFRDINIPMASLNNYGSGSAGIGSGAGINNFATSQLTSSIPARSTKLSKSYFPPGECTDVIDYTVLKFGEEVCLRGNVGTYLMALPTLVESSAGSTAAAAASSSSSSSYLLPSGALHKPGHSHGGPITVYSLAVSGQGIGETCDCLTFVNIEKSKEQEHLRYGMTVAIRSTAAKERLLGVKDSKPGFYRNLIGQGEKWVVLKGTASGRGPEDTDSRGKYVRVGDLLILQTVSTEQLLIFHEGPHGSEAKFIHREAAGVLGSELWQLELFRSQPNPLWLNRPYLSNQFLLQPPQARVTANDVESRTFPGHANSGSSKTGTSQQQQQQQQHQLPPLSSLSFNDQQLILMREILLVLSGVEGQYIRIKASASSAHQKPLVASLGGTTNTSQLSSMPIAEASRRLQEITFVIDIDSTNRSIASQVSHLFPLCEAIIHIREFLRLHSRYDFGLVSHAAVASIKAIVREFDVVIAQLEHLLLSNKLSLQKMVYLLHPSKATLCGVVAPLIRRIQNCSGGKLIDTLHALYLEQGDSKAKDIILYTLQKASEPFLEMLSAWLFRGDLNDPYKEFMIQEDTSISRDALKDDFNAQYWEHRYTLRDRAAPKLMRDYAMKALVAGKYLNVVRECLKDLIDQSGRSEVDSTLASSSSQVLTSPMHANAASSSFLAAHEFNDAHHQSISQQGQLALSWMHYINHIHESPQPLQLGLPLTAGAVDSEGYGNSHSSSLSSSFSSSSNNLSDVIHSSYRLSSQLLLKLLKEIYLIQKHIQSLKKFYFLENGDFFIQFMDLAEDELKKDVQEITLSRLQNLLQLAVVTSTLATDSNKDDFSCSLANNNLIQHLHMIQSAGDTTTTSSSSSTTSISSAIGSGFGGMTTTTTTTTTTVGGSVVPAPYSETQGLKGFEALTLEYQVGWPMSIVLSKRAITKYQLLSRLLYFSKHVERRVLVCWSEHQSTKQLDVKIALKKSYCLRHRMLHFLQNFVYYMTFEVIYPRSHELEQSLSTETCHDVDEMLHFHDKYLDICLKECLLASQDLLKILMKIMTTCLLFADNMKRWYVEDQSAASGPTSTAAATKAAAKTAAGLGPGSSQGENIRHQARVTAQQNRQRSEFIVKETSHESFIKMLAKFEVTFDTQLKDFLDRLWADSFRHHPQLSNLCVRLDYNGYYTQRFNSGDEPVIGGR